MRLYICIIGRYVTSKERTLFRYLRISCVLVTWSCWMNDTSIRLHSNVSFTNHKRKEELFGCSSCTGVANAADDVTPL